jgi:hypothetical protein
MSTEYNMIDVESYYESGSGLHGNVHIRPLPNQSPFETSMRVECSKEMMDSMIYAVGTKFRIKAKITCRQGGTPFIYSSYAWPFTVIK